MDVEDILTLCNVEYLDSTETVSEGEDFVTFGIEAINDLVQNDMPLESLPEAEDEISATKDTWVALENDFLSVIEVRDSDKGVYTDEYQLRETVVEGTFTQQIKFTETATFTVHYRQLPARLTDLDDIPGIHPVYHPALAIGVAAKYFLYDDEEDPRGPSYMQMFQAKILELSLRIDKQRVNHGHEYPSLEW